MLRFGEANIAKEKFYAAKKNINSWDVHVDNMVISKLAKTNTNSKYLITYLNKAMRPLVLIMAKLSGYLRHLKIKMDIKIKTIN